MRVGKIAREAEIDCPAGRVKLKIVDRPNSRSFKMWADSPGSAVVSKPPRAALKDALSFARSNAAWLAEALANFTAPVTLRERLEKFPRVCAEGDSLAVWLKPSAEAEFFVRTKTELGIVYKAPAGDESVERVFREFARETVVREAGKISDETGLGFSKISVRSQNSRWASRSASGELSFNWRVMLLPERLQQYVFRHELAHVKFMDHSTAFWIFLNRLIPGARRLDAELSKIGAEIFRVGR